MKTTSHSLLIAVLVAGAAALTGCDRSTRSNPTTDERHRAQTSNEGGAVSVKGDAGKSENFGDTQSTKESTGVSPGESPTGLSKDATPGKAPSVTPQVPDEPASAQKK